MFDTVGYRPEGADIDRKVQISGIDLDGAVYLCNRDTGIAVYNKLSELVGIYVTKVEG